MPRLTVSGAVPSLSVYDLFHMQGKLVHYCRKLDLEPIVSFFTEFTTRGHISI
jgi:hypothetical protein